nr:MAG TPA: hypothetical protein [Caudoviricetes sp.]
MSLLPNISNETRVLKIDNGFYCTALKSMLRKQNEIILIVTSPLLSFT